MIFTYPDYPNFVVVKCQTYQYKLLGCWLLNQCIFPINIKMENDEDKAAYSQPIMRTHENSKWKFQNTKIKLA